VWESKVGLTNRQRAFLEKLLDVYHIHHRESVHYTTLARALGVANSTAYEMLKALEQKGYVSSEYHLPDRPVAGGRSMVRFRPTMKGLRMFRHLAGEDIRNREWDGIKDKVFARLSAEGLPGDNELLSELLGAIPQSEDPLSYCGRVIAASLVSMRGHVANRVQQLAIFREMVAGEKWALDALDLLPGFAIGFASALSGGSARLTSLAESVKRYQKYLQQMDEETRRRLLRFSREMMDALQISTGPS
jgi:DNA-binding MarR family transcriptional regulator